MDKSDSASSIRGEFMSNRNILIVDDDKVTLDLLKEVFEKEGYHSVLAVAVDDALAKFATSEFPVVLSDIRMLGADGLELLNRVKKSNPSTVVILMTGFGNLDGAVKAIQAGAFDYISKPFRFEDLKSIVARAFKHWETTVNTSDRKSAKTTVEHQKGLIGKSPLIVEVYKLLARAALSSSSVLITGESGTGKELVARAIHENSARKNKKYLAINCGALTETLLESEFFGHKKGSFTGAQSDKMGILEEADGGTLFLDEIGDLSSALQVKLLRVLQEGEFKPVGSNEVKKVDIRFVGATHRNLQDMVDKGKFREDLYYRLKVLEISIPPLRERMEDLPELIQHFIDKYAEKNAKQISHISPEAMSLLQAYQWPGNIRELEHAIERAVAMSRTSVIFPEDLPSLVEEGKIEEKEEAKKSNSLEDLEKEHILTVLREVGFNKSKAAALLGIDRATLYRKAQKYGIDLKSER